MSKSERVKLDQANLNISPVGLSPLDQIQAAEMEVTRQVAAAHSAADLLLAQEKARLTDLKRAAQDTGRSAGQAEYSTVVTQAEAAAQDILRQADQQAESFRATNTPHLDELVRYVVNFITGRPD